MANFTVRTIKGDSIIIRDGRGLEVLAKALVSVGFVSTTKVTWIAQTESEQAICILAHAVESISPKTD